MEGIKKEPSAARRSRQLRAGDRLPEDWPPHPYIPEAIAFRVNRLVANPPLSPADRPDLEQQLALHLWKQLPRYDSSRASIETFVNRVLERKAKSHIRWVIAKCRNSRKKDCRGPRKPSRALAIQESSQRQIEIRLDVEAAATGLTDLQRRICDLLKCQSQREVARQLGITRYRMNFELGEIRQRFEDLSLNEWL